MCTNSFFIRRLLELFSTVAMSTVSMRIVVMRYRPWRRERVLTGQERLENTSTKTNHQQNAIPFSQVRTSLLSLSLSPRGEHQLTETVHETYLTVICNTDANTRFSAYTTRTREYNNEKKRVGHVHPRSHCLRYTYRTTMPYN